MSYCANCRRHYAEPADEQGDHPCPKCGLFPRERDDRESEEDDDETT